VQLEKETVQPDPKVEEDLNGGSSWRELMEGMDDMKGLLQ
jgi:hypothetical protein